MTTNPVPHVLIVDDEADMRELLCDLIESNGLRATAVEDGATMRVELDSGEAVAPDVGCTPPFSVKRVGEDVWIAL